MIGWDAGGGGGGRNGLDRSSARDPLPSDQNKSAATIKGWLFAIKLPDRNISSRKLAAGHLITGRFNLITC